MNTNIARAAVGVAAIVALLGASNKPTVAGNDTLFADRFAQAGMAEISLAKVAMMKSKNPQVLAFASKMVHDHTKAGNKLAAIAVAEQISLPETVTPQDAAITTKLENTPPSEFDAAYKLANAQGHAKALALISREISSGSDPKLMTFAKTAEPTVESHAMLVKKLPAS